MNDRQRIRELERELSDVRRQAQSPGRLARPVDSPQTFLAQIVEVPSGYLSATQFPVYRFEFVDSTFTEAVGIQTPTTTIRTGQTYYAACLGPSTFAVDDLVVVTKKNNRWWIDTVGETFRRGILTPNVLSSGSTATVQRTVFYSGAWHTTSQTFPVREAAGIVADLAVNTVVYCNWDNLSRQWLMTGSPCG